MGDAGAIFLVGLLVLGLVGVAIVMPFVALATARRARRQVERLEIEVRDLRRIAMGVPAPPSGFAPRPRVTPAAAPEPAPSIVEPLPSRLASPSLPPEDTLPSAPPVVEPLP